MPVLDDSSDTQRHRRTELAHFLRARRASLVPGDVGIPSGKRRRTPGLRREEVAQLAGIGVTWYTFLEQGRPVRVSQSVLDRLADVFSLNIEERRHLVQLASDHTPEPGLEAEHAVTEELRAILDKLDPHPAYVLNERFDMIAWNRSASLVFSYSTQTPERDRNVIRRLVTDPAKRRLHLDFEAHVRNTIAAFRPHYSRHAHDPAVAAFVEELQAESRDFKRWWSQHEVLDATRLQMTLHMAHPVLGTLTGRYTFLGVFGRTNLTLCIFTPSPESARSISAGLEAPHSQKAAPCPT